MQELFVKKVEMVRGRFISEISFCVPTTVLARKNAKHILLSDFVWVFSAGSVGWGYTYTQRHGQMVQCSDRIKLLYALSMKNLMEQVRNSDHLSGLAMI